jgi:hypothetical protein
MSKTIRTTKPAPAHRPCDYRAIAGWGKMLGSYQYYITGEQEKASRMNAPVDALYERNGVWVTVRDLKPDHHFRVWYETATA